MGLLTRPWRWLAQKMVNSGLEQAEAEAAREDARWYRSPGYQHLQRVLAENELRGRYAEERCFITGNGPSLGKMELDQLASEHTIGTNRIYLMFDKLGWTPEFYICVNVHVIRQSVEEIRKVKCLKFLNHEASRYIGEDSRTVFVRSLLRRRFIRGFSTDVQYGWCEGATVTNCALQLAYYLGFSPVILIGVDHYYSARGRPHKLVTSRGADPDHFSSDYFGAGVQWQLPDLAASERSYRIAKAEFENAGRKVLDATVGGKLDVFPKVEYGELF